MERNTGVRWKELSGQVGERGYDDGALSLPAIRRYERLPTGLQELLCLAYLGSRYSYYNYRCIFWYRCSLQGQIIVLWPLIICGSSGV